MSFLNCFTQKLGSSKDRKFKISEEFSKDGISSTYNALADTDLHIGEVPDSEQKQVAGMSGFDTARESDSPVPTALAEIATPQPKSNRFTAEKQNDSYLQFVKALPARPEYRCEVRH